MKSRPLARMGLIAGALSVALLATQGEARASLYTYSTQQISNIGFTGGTIGALASSSTASAVSDSGSEGHVNGADSLQSYVGPAPRPAENFFGQVGQTNPNFVRGDVLVSPTTTATTVAEGYLVGLGTSAGSGAFSLTGLLTVTNSGAVTLNFNYTNLLQVINTGGTPTNSASATYSFIETISTPGTNGTVVHALVERLAEYGRNVSMLDGDEIRTHLSKGLGFSKEDRDTNIRRVGFVAGLVAQHGGTTLCSVISPYRAVRDEARKQSKGNFVEVFCDTPLDVCEKRDVKGLYAKARTAVAEGKPMGFTGVDDPYEAPLNPEVTIDTSKLDVQQSADKIVAKLLELGYIEPHAVLSA